MNTHVERTANSKEVWVGRLEVSPISEKTVLHSVEGAYVNALVPAESEADFRRRVTEVAHALGLEVRSIEEPMPVRWLVGHRRLDEDLVRLAEEAGRSDQVQFATFHTYGAK